MKFGGILNSKVSEILASMGHGQMLIISDAGFPIPKDAWYVDLAIKENLPKLETILEIVAEEFIAEKVIFAKEVETSNQKLYGDIKYIFSDATLETIEHDQMLNNIAHEAKAIIRTGAYNPWGNIALVSGTNPYAWFEKGSKEVPSFYKERFEQIDQSQKKNKYLN